MDFHAHGFDFDDDGDCLIGECNEIHPNYRMREEKCKKPLRTPEGEWIFQILKKAFAQPPKFSTLERYLHHQQTLLALGVDNEGNAERSVRDDCFPGNPNPRHHFSLRGKICSRKPKKVPKGFSFWDSDMTKQQELYIMSDCLTKQLRDEYHLIDRILPVFRDERLKSKFYPKFVRDDYSKQEMYLNFDAEIV